MYLLDAVAARLGDEVELDGDYYWDLPVQSAFDLSNPSPDLTTGQLADDLVEIREALADPSSTFAAAWHPLQHFIAVLRAVERAMLP